MWELCNAYIRLLEIYARIENSCSQHLFAFYVHKAPIVPFLMFTISHILLLFNITLQKLQIFTVTHQKRFSVEITKLFFLLRNI